MKQDDSIILERGENGYWVATALEIDGAFSQGKTLEEARENVLDAIRELLLAQRDQNEAEFAQKLDVQREIVTVEI